MGFDDYKNDKLSAEIRKNDIEMMEKARLRKEAENTVTTVEGKVVILTDEPLTGGKPYVFKENEGDDWNYGESFPEILDAGNQPMIETMIPNMIRKSIK